MDPVDAIKTASEGYAAYYGDVRRQLTNEFAADSRWTLASLFALNSGGLVGLSQVEVHTRSAAIAMFLFWFGIALAFWLTSYSQKRTKEFNDAISQLEAQYVLASATGRLDEAEGLRLEGAKKEVSTKLAPYLSIGSFIAFSGGLLAIAIALAPTK